MLCRWQTLNTFEKALMWVELQWGWHPQKRLKTSTVLFSYFMLMFLEAWGRVLWLIALQNGKEGTGNICVSKKKPEEAASYLFGCWPVQWLLPVVTGLYWTLLEGICESRKSVHWLQNWKILGIFNFILYVIKYRPVLYSKCSVSVTCARAHTHTVCHSTAIA